MHLRYLFDENIRGPLWNAVEQHNAAGVNPIDVVRVGDPADLPLGSPDPAILLWAEREGRILVSKDRKTLSAHLTTHLQAGRHLPGVFIVRRKSTIAAVLFQLVLAVYAGDPGSFQDRIEDIP